MPSSSPATGSARFATRRGGSGHRRHRLQPHHQRRILPAAEIRPHRSRAPTTSTITAPPTTPPSPPPSKAHATEASLRDIAAAKAILLLGNDPTEQHPGLAWQIRTNVRLNQARLYVANHALIKLRRQATAFLQIPEDGYAGLVVLARRRTLRSLDSNTDATAFRDALRKEESLVVVFGSEFRGRDLSALVAFGATLPNVKFACLGDYANSRGAADMGLYPDLLPGYIPVSVSADFAREYPALPGRTRPRSRRRCSTPPTPASSAPSISLAPTPSPATHRHSDALQKTFIIVQDMFLTETAQFADVILPAANLYEKSGTVTNTFGDLQLVKKAADRAGVRTDFELIVRLAAAMGADVKKLVPFGTNGVRADFGQTRGAQSGEADRHGVWLVAHNLEPKLSPFDPFAIFDEIQRLVPSYDVPRLDLLTGNDQHLQPALVQIENIASRPDLVLPSNDTLFTSGSLGLYSKTLHSVLESRKPVETAAGSPGAPAVGAMGS